MKWDRFKRIFHYFTVDYAIELIVELQETPLKICAKEIEGLWEEEGLRGPMGSV